MTKNFRSSLDPHGITARILRLVTGVAVMAGFFSGASAAREIQDLNSIQLEAALGKPNAALQDFIGKLEHAMLTGDVAAAEAMVDRDAILARATEQVRFAGDETVRELFCESTRRAWNERGLTRDYANTRFRFLRAREFGGRSGLLFRSVAKSGATNYALLTVNETEPGNFRITDIFVVGLNEYMSQTLHRTWLNVAAGFLGEDARSLPGVNPEYVANISQVAQASRLMNSGKYEMALKTSRELPASVQKERSVLLLQIEAADHISSVARREAYSAWLKAYPDEQELPLKLAEFYMSERRFGDAERVLRGLMDRVGPDTQLKREIGSMMFRRDNDKGYAQSTLSAK